MEHTRVIDNAEKCKCVAGSTGSLRGQLSGQQRLGAARTLRDHSYPRYSRCRSTTPSGEYSEQLFLSVFFFSSSISTLEMNELLIDKSILLGQALLVHPRRRHAGSKFISVLLAVQRLHSCGPTARRQRSDPLVSTRLLHGLEARGSFVCRSYYPTPLSLQW